MHPHSSSVGVGAVLEQGGKDVGYASHALLTKAECQYSVIQRECLATVYRMKQFRHYLLGNASSLSQIIPLCSGCRHRKWRICSVYGLWQCNSMTLQLSIRKEY